MTFMDAVLGFCAQMLASGVAAAAAAVWLRALRPGEGRLAGRLAQLGRRATDRGMLRRRDAQAPGSQLPPTGAPSRRTVLFGMLAATGASSACDTRSVTAPAVTQAVPPPPPEPPKPASTPSSRQPPTAPVLTRSGGDITTGPGDSKAVALTFHGAGDPSVTTTALSIAASAGAGLTVFAVGQWLAANMSLGRDILAAGHELGNHTWSHQVMPGLTLAQAVDEVQRGADAVAAVAGQAGLLFRPSGTAASTPIIRSAAQAAGYHRCVSYDVDPLDYADPGAELVASRTLSAVRPGSIVSLHLGHPDTIAALPRVLDGLAARGLAPVTVSALLASLP